MRKLLLISVAIFGMLSGMNAYAKSFFNVTFMPSVLNRAVLKIEAACAEDKPYFVLVEPTTIAQSSTTIQLMWNDLADKCVDPARPLDQQDQYFMQMGVTIPPGGYLGGTTWKLRLVKVLDRLNPVHDYNFDFPRDFQLESQIELSK